MAAMSAIRRLRLISFPVESMRLALRGGGAQAVQVQDLGYGSAADHGHVQGSPLATVQAAAAAAIKVGLRESPPPLPDTVETLDLWLTPWSLDLNTLTLLTKVNLKSSVRDSVQEMH